MDELVDKWMSVELTLEGEGMRLDEKDIILKVIRKNWEMLKFIFLEVGWMIIKKVEI